MNIARFASAGLSLALTGCFAPDAPVDTAGQDGSDTATETDDSGSGTQTTTTTESDTSADTTDGTQSGPGTDGPTTGDTGTDDTGSADETSGSAAPVVELLVNGSAEPEAVEEASEVFVEATVTDVDGSVQSVEVLFDGTPISSPVVSNGDTWVARFVISGADDNGTHLIEAVATDDDDLSSSDSVNIDYDLPNGGLVEAWNFDNGEGGTVLGLHPTPDGDELVWSGQTFSSGDQGMRIDRIVGPVWQKNATNSDDLGSDVHPLPNGGYIGASAQGDSFDLQTRLRRYAPNGTTVEAAVFDGSDNGESNWPLGVEVDDAGDYYLLGAFVGPEQFESYLLKTNVNLTQEWRRSVSASPSTDGTPFVHDFDVRPDGRIALAGAETSRLWVATMNLDGELEDQVTLVSEFDQSIGYDIAWTPAGDLVVAGTVNEGDDWARLVRMYDDTLSEQWTVQGPANGDFAMAVTADDHGHIVVASTENCNFDGISQFMDCRLILRSYDEDGGLRWQHNAENGGSEFLGPLLFRPGAKSDIEVDRFGYVYVSAFHERPLGGGETRSEWWAQQHHP